ncbi:MAG: sigma 54-interacting transcriptional regulator [Deltaproteobacteria bacterium]|nr:sigma 54-interacting transcriptional regulator [Deltaproteobacteria bacterium]
MPVAPPHEVSLARILDSITDPLVVYDRDYRIVMANRALMAIHRRIPESTIGMRCYGVFYGRDSACEECHVRDLFDTGEPQFREKILQLPDGRRRHFEIHAYPVRNAEGTVFQAIEHGRDVSDRKALENRIKTSEEKYHAIVEAAREGIFITDGEARVTFANRRLAGMLGFGPDEIIGRSLFDLMDEGSKTAMQEQLDRRRKDTSDIYELNFRSRNGKYLVGLVSAAPLMVDDSFLGSVGIVTDISRMKQVESELRSAKEFSEKIINNITDNLVVVNPATHRIVQANTSFLSRTGHALDETLDRPCYEVILNRKSPCWEDGIVCPVRIAAASKRPAQCDKVYLNSDGQERMLHIHTYPLIGDTGEAELVIRMERDVTEKRKMEEALAFRSKELQKTQHQLETLFEVSRRVGAESSLRGLILFLQRFAEEIFPDSDSIFLLLETSGERFFSHEKCCPEAINPLSVLQQDPERGREAAEFAHHLRAMKDPRVVTSADDRDLHPLLERIAEPYPSWFGLPVIVRQECIGYFLLGSKTATGYLPEDLRFFQELFAQTAGHIRSLVLHESETGRFRKDPGEPPSRGEIVGQSKKIREIYDLIDLVATSDATVLITGENGTGKELVAQAIHRQNYRRSGPFVVANCSAYSPSLLESELFGHEKGAFTGAIRQKKGRIERAQGGTLFLDEIGDISLATQVLLLRFLQDRCFERVGGEQTIEVDVRVLAATNRDLRREADEGRFRDDLYYRLNVFSINLPSLRERKEDIPLLARHFLARFGAKEGRELPRLGSDAMQALMEYHWPGNVRQLENALSYAVILCQGEEISLRHMPPFLKETEGGSAEISLGEMERRMILRALEESSWNKHETARRLKVSRSTLYSKIRRHGLLDNPGER